MIGSTSGAETKSAHPASSQSKRTQTRFSSVGARNTFAPLLPCSARLSAPFLVNTSRNRSTSSTCVVARIMDLPLAWIPKDLVAPTGRSALRSLSGSATRRASVDLPISGAQFRRPNFTRVRCSGGGDALDDLVRDRPAGRSGPVGDADLRVDVLHVMLGGPRRDEQLGGDLAGG